MVLNRRIDISGITLFVSGLIATVYLALEFYQFNSRIFEDIHFKKQQILVEQENLNSFAQIMAELIMKSSLDVTDVQNILLTSPSLVISGPLPLVQSISFYDEVTKQAIGRLGLIPNPSEFNGKVGALQTWKGNPEYKTHIYDVSSPDGILGKLGIITPQSKRYVAPHLWDTFRLFLEASFIKAAIALTFIIGALTIGFGMGFRRILSIRRIYSSKLKEFTEQSTNEHNRLCNEIFKLESELAVKQVRNKILNDQTIRHEEAAKQSLVINKVIEQLLSQEFSENATGDNINSIVAESASALRKASQGLLPQKQLEITCINDTVDQVLTEFEDIFLRTETTLQKTSSNNVYQDIDVELMCSLIRQILLDIVGRLLKDHTIHVEVCSHSGTKVAFKDDGHVLKTNTPTHPLDHAMKQANTVGWKISCESGVDSSLTILHIPNNENYTQDNIVPIFDRKKHV